MRKIHGKVGLGCYFTLLPIHKLNTLGKPEFCLSNYYQSNDNLTQDFIRKETDYGFNAQTFKINWEKDGSYLTNGADLGRSKIYVDSLKEDEPLKLSKIKNGLKFNLIKDFEKNEIRLQSREKKTLFITINGCDALFNDKSEVKLKKKDFNENTSQCLNYKLIPFDILNKKLIVPKDIDSKKIPEVIASNAYFVPGSIIEKDTRYYSQYRYYYFIFNSINSVIEIYESLPDNPPVLKWPIEPSDKIKGDFLVFNATGNFEMSEFVSDPTDPFANPSPKIVYQSNHGSEYSELLLLDDGTLMIRNENGFAIWYKNSPKFQNNTESLFLLAEHNQMQYFFDAQEVSINKKPDLLKLFHFRFKLNQDRETYTLIGKNFREEEKYLSYDKNNKQIVLQEKEPEQGFFIPYHPKTHQLILQPANFPQNGYLGTCTN